MFSAFWQARAVAQGVWKCMTRFTSGRVLRIPPWNPLSTPVCALQAMHRRRWCTGSGRLEPRSARALSVDSITGYSPVVSATKSAPSEQRPRTASAVSCSEEWSTGVRTTSARHGQAPGVQIAKSHLRLAQPEMLSSKLSNPPVPQHKGSSTGSCPGHGCAQAGGRCNAAIGSRGTYDMGLRADADCGSLESDLLSHFAGEGE